MNILSSCTSVGQEKGAEGPMARVRHRDPKNVFDNMLMADNDLGLKLCTRMEQGRIDVRAFITALKACSTLADREEGKNVNGRIIKQDCLEKGTYIHSDILKSGYEGNIYVASTLIAMYAKCGSMVNAREIFDKMRQRNVVCWTALMLGYVENGEGALALQLYSLMRLQGCVPDARVFVAAIKACSSLAAEEDGMEIDGTLVKMGCLQKGVVIHRQAAMCNLTSDMYVSSTLLDLYAKCGSMVDARKVFDEMPRRDVVSWTALMLGYIENGKDELALKLFTVMRSEGFMPDAPTFVAALKACGNLSAFEAGENIHSDICKHGLEKVTVITNSLVDFYGKCGMMVVAEEIFDSVTKKDIVTWSALIAGYSRLGDTERVFDLFQLMRKEGLQANSVTFLSILTACSHAGLVNKGKEYFQIMFSEFQIRPGVKHYRCMIDLYGRCNQLNNALETVKNMPYKPDAVTWITLLSACRKWKNVVVGKLAFDSLLKLDDKHGGAYAMMSNIYSSAGMWDEKYKVQAMRNARAWKSAGQSCWIDCDGTVHRFVAGDSSHPQRENIAAVLKQVMRKMKGQGYVADVSSVFEDLPDDEKEDVLCGHSEKLAIACALLNTASGTTIRIVKNLRVCDDCHKATAVISKIEQRQIICRDASRFHIFKDGSCSCGEFW